MKTPNRLLRHVRSLSLEILLAALVLTVLSACTKRSAKILAPPLLAEAEGEAERSGYTDPDGALHFRHLQLQDERGEIPPDAWEKARAHIELMKGARERRMRQRSEAGLPTEGIEGAGIDPGSWTWLGPGNVGGRIRSIVIHPTQTNRMWVGSVSGGIWHTENGGSSWAPVDDFLANLAVTSMVLVPFFPDTMYAGTGEGFRNVDAIRGAGVFKSTDGGVGWTRLPNTNPAAPDPPGCGVGAAPCSSFWNYVNRVAVSQNGSLLLAATSDGANPPAGGGIARSTDGGMTWTQRTNSAAMDVKIQGPGNLRAVAGELGSARYTLDGGVTWTAATFSPSISNGGTAATDGRVELAVHKTFPFEGFVYASVNQNNGEVFRSNDGGQSYTRYSTGVNYLLGASNQGWYDNTIWSNPNDPDNVIVGGIFLWRGTIDFGTGTLPLTQISDGSNSPHADNHIIIEHPAFDNSGNRIVYVGNDGGIFRADNFASSGIDSGWTELNNALGITQFYGAAVNSSGLVIGGAQDNGTQRFAGNPEGWTEMNGSDGGYCAADPTDPNFLYGESQNLNVVRGTDAGLSASAINSGLGDANTNSNFIAPLIIDPIDPNTLLAGGWSVWRTTNAKAVGPAQPTWASIKGPAPTPVPTPGTTPTPPPVSAIGVSPISSDLILVGHNDGKVYRTFNGTAANPVWSLISAGLPAGRFVTRLVIDPNHATNWYYATFGGFNADNIYRSIDNGGSWTAVTGSGMDALPAAPVRTLAVNPIDPLYLYAGTEVGIFTSEDGGVTWQLPQDGPANVSVDEIFFDNQKRLFAATHGRGIFRTDGPVLVPPQVTSANDSGVGSLRDAIVQAALVTGTERRIRFSIPGSGVQTINLSSALPIINVPMTIDGSSQAGTGYMGPPLIELNGAGAGLNAFGLILTGGNSTVRGLTINRFSGSGILLANNGGNKVQGCYIGVNAAGDTVAGNAANGIEIDNIPNNYIGRDNRPGDANIIGGNAVGVVISGSNASGNLVRGNYIGTNPSIAAPRLSNLLDGVRITGAPNNTIGGEQILHGNVISGNGVNNFGADGVEISGAAASGNKVQGNYLGLASFGNTPLGNLGSGVRVDNAPNTIVGGLTNVTGIAPGNVITDNRNQGGIALVGAGSSGAIVQGNIIGANYLGAVPLPNNANGIYLESGNNRIGGTDPFARNLITGYDITGGIGIYFFGVAGATGNVIEGNYIGTNLAGTAQLSRVGTGIELRGGVSGTVIGGSAAARNLISGNHTGIYDYTSNTIIRGNYIGTNPGGAAAVPNVIGVIIDGGSNHRVGGLLPGEGNVISGNGTGGNDHGIRLANSTGVKVEGNRIGTNAAGTAALGNGGSGIQVFNSANATIGGANSAARNIISGNRDRGIMLSSDTGTIIQGNYIGTDVNGTIDLGNGHLTGLSGIEMAFTTAATIGGPNPGEANIIAFSGCVGCAGVNSGAGVKVQSGTTQTRILRNSIFNNLRLGIDLLGGSEGSTGVTPNDNCDGDSGPNNLQNFPILTSAQTSGAVTTIAGSLNSTANSTFRVDFYSSPSCDPSGNGQGKTHLGFTNVNTDGTCNVSFQAMLNLVLPQGSVVTATATDAAGNTSEFSGCVASVVPPAVPVSSAASRKTHGGAGTFDIDLPLSGTPGIECRSGGANFNHTIVFSFANTLASVGAASVTSGNGSVVSAVIGSDAHEFIVTLAGVTDAQYTTVTLENIADSAGNASSAISVALGLLVADTNANGSVNAGDVLQTRGRSGSPPDANSFRSDVTVDGNINAGDVLAVRSRAGNALP